MPNEIYVDPEATEASVIKVGGECYQRVGPVDHEPTIDDVEEFTSCEECEGSSSSGSGQECCYYMWTQTFTCSNNTWGSVTQSAHTCAGEDSNPYGNDGDNNTWVRNSHSDSSCVYQYVTKVCAPSCSGSGDCSWPGAPASQTGTPSNCCWGCSLRMVNCCFSSKSIAIVDIEWFDCYYPEPDCEGAGRIIRGEKWSGTLQIIGSGTWTGTVDVTFADTSAPVACPKWGSTSAVSRSVAMNGVGSWSFTSAGAGHFLPGDCCGATQDTDECINAGGQGSNRYVTKVSISIQNNECCKGESGCQKMQGNCNGSCNEESPP